MQTKADEKWKSNICTSRVLGRKLVFKRMYGFLITLNNRMGYVIELFIFFQGSIILCDFSLRPQGVWERGGESPRRAVSKRVYPFQFLKNLEQLFPPNV